MFLKHHLISNDGSFFLEAFAKANVVDPNLPRENTELLNIFNKALHPLRGLNFVFPRRIRGIIPSKTSQKTLFPNINLITYNLCKTSKFGFSEFSGFSGN